MKQLKLFALLLLLLLAYARKKPNILILLADDVGIGDIGCYGNDTINTPNIDKLCRNGIKLNHNLAAAPLCTPSRASLVTGRYPVKVGYVARNIGETRVAISTTAKGGLPQEETTFAEVFKENGYTNGFFGKWHLGIHCDEKDFCHHPLENGFDYYFGMPLTNLMDCGNWPIWGLQSEAVEVPDSKLFLAALGVVILTCLIIRPPKWLMVLLLLVVLLWYGFYVGKYYLMRQFNCMTMRNKEVAQQPVQLDSLTSVLVEETKQFLNANRENPFLAYVAFHKAHVALATASRFVGASQYGSYGDAMMELDWGVGEILNELERLELTKDTIVYFTSDHGPALYAHNKIDGEYQGGWPGIYRGGKGYNYEGGIRVPKIVQWSGKLEGGLVIDRPTSHLDLFPTIISLAGLSYDGSSNLDGEDISGIYLGNKDKQKDRILYHYCGVDIHAVTVEDQAKNRVWKVHFSIPSGPDDEYGPCYGDAVTKLEKPIIYDLVTSPSEDSPLPESDPSYKNLWKFAAESIRRFNETVDFSVTNQLSLEMNSFSFDRAMCCNYPHCSC